MTDFEGLLRQLHGGNVEFIIVGGMAAISHGAARVTYDLDVIYNRTTENIIRLVAALDPIHPYLRGAPPGLPFRWDAETISTGLNFTLVTDLGDLDVLGDIPGGRSYLDLLPHSAVVEIESVPCRCLNLEKLIQVKRAAARKKDLDAIVELEALLRERDQRDVRE